MAAGISIPFYLDDARFFIVAKTGVRAHGANAKRNATISSQALIWTSYLSSGSTRVHHRSLSRPYGKMLQIPSAEIDTGRFLHSYGIDSLVAIEIVNWVLKELKAAPTVIDVMAGVVMTTTVRKIASSSTLCAWFIEGVEAGAAKHPL